MSPPDHASQARRTISACPSAMLEKYASAGPRRGSSATLLPTFSASEGASMGGQQNSRKVAVLGGGPAALAAAFALSDPALAGRFQVTVYQPRWRLAVN